MGDPMHVFRGARDACTAFATAMSRHGTFCRGETVTVQSLDAMIPHLDALCIAHPLAATAVAHYKQLCRLLIFVAAGCTVDTVLLSVMRTQTEALMKQIETVCIKLPNQPPAS